MELFDIYLLNLIVTVAMFITLVFRAWIELKNFQVMWKEAQWRRLYETVGRVLLAEKDMFARVEGGGGLYEILCKIFGVEPIEGKIG